MSKLFRPVVGIFAFAALALCGTSAWATDTPFTCTTEDGAGLWKITATQPQVIDCGGLLGEGGCGSEDPAHQGAECSAITYTIEPLFGDTPDHVSVLVTHDVDVIQPSANNVFDPCQGDKVTELGLHDCSSQAVRINPQSGTAQTLLCVVGGTLSATTSSVVVKKGRNVIEECRIASLGTNVFDPNAQRTASQEVTFKGCTVSIPTDPVTGEGGVATITGEDCVFVANAEPVSAGELLVNGQSVGTLTFGEGSVSSGTASCTTKVILRRIYTWCTCDDVDGDGIPDDPSPPCVVPFP